MGLDFLLTGLVALVTVLAIQSVGLVLAIALLIIPASTALLWSRRLSIVVLLSAMLGGFSAWLGAMISASIPRMPTGPVIVLVCAGLFFISLLAGRRGVLQRWLAGRSLSRQVSPLSFFSSSRRILLLYEIFFHEDYTPNFHISIYANDYSPYFSLLDRSLLK